MLGSARFIESVAKMVCEFVPLVGERFKVDVGPKPPDVWDVPGELEPGFRYDVRPFRRVEMWKRNRSGIRRWLEYHEVE